jgi:hypothetical protein
MSTSLENYCEQVEVLLLSAQLGAQGISIVRQDENSGASKDRIVVSHANMETELFAPDGVTQLVIKIPITVEIHLIARDVARMDTLLAGIMAAQTNGATAALALAATAFPGGAFIRPTDTGARKSTGNSRVESRVFEFIITLQTSF